jgi:hypothetical protein
MTASTLSVAVRPGPAETAVNGTVVAWPTRQPSYGLAARHGLDRRVRPNRGNACLVGKGRRPTAGVGDQQFLMPCGPSTDQGDALPRAWGKHPRTAPDGLSYSSRGMGIDRGCPWMTAVV